MRCFYLLLLQTMSIIIGAHEFRHSTKQRKQSRGWCFKQRWLKCCVPTTAGSEVHHRKSAKRHTTSESSKGQNSTKRRAVEKEVKVVRRKHEVNMFPFLYVSGVSIHTLFFYIFFILSCGLEKDMHGCNILQWDVLQLMWTMCITYDVR